MMFRNAPLEKKRFIFFQTGLFAALALALVAFQWTTVEYAKKSVNIIDVSAASIDEIVPLAPVPKPPAKAPANFLPSHEIIITDEGPSDESKKTPFLPIGDFDDLLDGDEGDEWVTDDDPIIFSKPIDPSKVHRGPHYSSCENPSDVLMELQCTRNAIIEYVQQNAVYPYMEKEAGMEGDATIAFVIGNDGQITNVEVVRATTKGFGKEAAAAVQLIPGMIPAMHFEQPVPVNFQIPVRFRLGH